MSRPNNFGRDPSYSNSGRGTGGDRRGSAKEPTESRRQKEKPCRTLFVHNIDYKITKDELKEVFEKYGEIRRVFPLIEKRGLAFVTFYDLRAANQAKQELQNSMIGNRQVNIHYSLPKEDDSRMYDDDDDPHANYGSIFVLFRNVKSVTNEEVSEFFKQWGDVREVRDGRAKNYCIKFVDYWDTRHAEKAIQEANGKLAFGGVVEARYANADKKEEPSQNNNYPPPPHHNYRPPRDDPYYRYPPPPSYYDAYDSRYPPPPSYYRDSRDYPPYYGSGPYPPPGGSSAYYGNPYPQQSHHSAAPNPTPSQDLLTQLLNNIKSTPGNPISNPSYSGSSGSDYIPPQRSYQ